MSSYQLGTNEVFNEIEWMLCENYEVFKDKFKKKFISFANSDQCGHLIVTLRIKDTVKVQESQLSFVDLVGFDDMFTQKIMSGEVSMSIHSNMSDGQIVEENIHLDLFSLRNLILSADQAQEHGYRLTDVSLCEERVLANIISHKLKTEH